MQNGSFFTVSSRTRNPGGAALGVASAALALACGDGAEVRCSNGAAPPLCVAETSAPAESVAPLAPDPTPEPSGEPEPAYLLGTRVFDDTTTMSYFSVVSGLDASVSVNQDEAIEV